MIIMIMEENKFKNLSRGPNVYIKIHGVVLIISEGIYANTSTFTHYIIEE